MRVELLCTGDELVTGLIADTNSPYAETRLFELGLKVARVQHVGDVRGDIEAALQEASLRADVVLVSGGLGPTADDFTVECAARAAGVPLVRDPGTLARLEERYAARGLALTPNNARQADVPEGCEVIPNPAGSAPMFALALGTCRFFFVPGVPREYRALVDGVLIPRLAEQLASLPGRSFRALRILKTVGLPESQLDARVAPLAAAHPRVVFGFRTHAPENHLKLMAEGPTQAAADEAAEAAARASREVLGATVFAEGDAGYIETLGAQLRACGATLAVAESCTGGLVSEWLTQEPGASDYFIGGAVVYAESMKRAWAGVSAATLELHGAVSAQTAGELACGIREQTRASLGLSVTGYAGPGGGTAADPVGTVYIALAGREGVLAEQRLSLPGDRGRVRLFASSAVLELLRHHLLAREVR